MKLKYLILAIAAASCASVQAADSINLGSYAVTGVYALDLTSGVVSGLEASGVTYARDRGTLFFVGDEGTGVSEISLTGQTIGSSAFDWTGTASSNHDTEGVTYLGNGVLVVGEERLQDAYRFNYVAGSTVTLANSYVSISNTNVGNNGMEGISYDSRGTGSFVTIKQQSPEDVLSGTLTFAGGAGGISTMAQLFDPALLGVSTLSDIQILSPVDSLIGTPGADNLLVLSLGSRVLLEVTRTGVIVSSFDLTNVLAHNAIEGVTVDQNGTIYLVAEQVQDGTALPGERSQLIVLNPVPEPTTWIMMIAGLVVIGAVTYRRRKSAL
jgi:uncharacterized protein YjiK